MVKSVPDGAECRPRGYTRILRKLTGVIRQSIFWLGLPVAAAGARRGEVDLAANT
jgi:hypothetical protein